MAAKSDNVRGTVLNFVNEDKSDISDEVTRIKEENSRLRKKLRKLSRAAAPKGGMKPRFFNVLQAARKNVQSKKVVQRHCMVLMRCLCAFHTWKIYYMGKKTNLGKTRGSLTKKVADKRESNIENSLSRYERLIDSLVKEIQMFGRVYVASRRDIEIVKKYMEHMDVQVVARRDIALASQEFQLVKKAAFGAKLKVVE
ncbi:unnamed protein product [Rhodiola kirilowii]